MAENKNNPKNEKTITSFEEKLNEYELEPQLLENIKTIKKLFANDETLITREFSNQNDSSIKCCAFFIDGMVNNEIVNENIIGPIIENIFLSPKLDVIDVIKSQVIISNDVKKTEKTSEIVKAIVAGDTVIFINGYSSALIISTKGWLARSIIEPDTEKALRGPREGFTEGIMTNLTLIRRRLQTNELKFVFRSFGTKSNTKVCICYIDNIIDKEILNELNRRLDTIDIDGILDSNYIVEMIKDAPMSPFKTIGITERPDTVASKLLEGRIALVVDGTPVVLTLPYLFIENFQANDDYYLNFYFASIGRFLRLIGFLISVSIPAVYVALTTFHREMIPTYLSLSIIEAHKNVPFPTIVECIIMLLVFEIIRETGIRMPSNIGQALSVVGALVIGQAAVEAKFISAPMVIVVSITAITGLINPKIKGVTVITRFLFLIAASFLGFYGYFYCIIILLTHLFSLHSFGVVYTSQLCAWNFQGLKDNSFRASWKYMITRPEFVKKNNIRKKTV